MRWCEPDTVGPLGGSTNPIFLLFKADGFASLKSEVARIIAAGATLEWGKFVIDTFLGFVIARGHVCLP